MAQGTSEVIDGSKTPDLIPDDMAYHLVLLVASAADDAPEVEKARASAVVSAIFDQLPREVPALAEAANGHRRSFAALTADTRSADAERLKGELLARVRAETDLRLPATAKAVLKAYVQAEKANIKLYGIPSMKAKSQVVESSLMSVSDGTVVATTSSCPGGGGGLAPYCRDNCTGSRPCDKLCRRDDESCTNCGEYGSCCCLGGGGGGNPPPPPPPPGGMAGQPTGAVYRNITLNDDLVLFATAVTDTSASCSCHSSRAGVTLRTPWGTVGSSSGIGAAWVQATVQYQLNMGTAGDIEFETDHYSFCPIQARVFIDVRPVQAVRAYPFTSRYVWDATYSHNVSVDDFYWGSQSPGDCQGSCMVPWIIRPHDEGLGHAWVRHQGIAVRLSYGISCGGKKRPAAMKPACIQPP